MSGQPLSATELDDFEDLVKKDKVDNMPADGGWYTPEEILATFKHFRETLRRLGHQQSVKTCPRCGGETKIYRRLLVASATSPVEYICACPSCKMWTMSLKEVTEEDKAASVDGGSW